MKTIFFSILLFTTCLFVNHGWASQNSPIRDYINSSDSASVYSDRKIYSVTAHGTLDHDSVSNNEGKKRKERYDWFDMEKGLTVYHGGKAIPVEIIMSPYLQKADMGFKEYNNLDGGTIIFVINF